MMTEQEWEEHWEKGIEMLKVKARLIVEDMNKRNLITAKEKAKWFIEAVDEVIGYGKPRRKGERYATP